MEMNNISYQVAGHTFRLSFSEEFLEVDRLNNYTPFQLERETEAYLFHLSITDNLSAEGIYEQVEQFDDDVASIGVFKSKEGNFRFRIAYPGSKEYCTMDTDISFCTASVRLPDNPQLHFFCVNNCLMLLYAFATAELDTLLLHASVINNKGEGYLFLGKSGTGKSTHSRLWLEHIAGSELLNDDNPVVRIIDGKAWVYGTPWSGKTSCYKNDNVPLKGIVKLRQAPENKIRKLSSLQAYAAVLPACSCMRWENELMAGVHSSVEKLATGVACCQLDCLPDKAAAELCCKTVKKENR